MELLSDIGVLIEAGCVFHGFFFIVDGLLLLLVRCFV